MTVRVRFAPSPTGLMHLGNVRVALLNYLYAKKNNGVFIVRIEDTDFARNVDPQASSILNDLAWLHLTYDEGPRVGGPYAPYFQSERAALYTEKLRELEKKERVYPCFCTVEELEKKRQRQIALHQPPRYDRACLKLSGAAIKENFARHKPFIWRLITTQEKEISIRDLARGTTTFNLKDFSDIPLTRADGSFTFIFANAVDDITMKISTIIRGEDHISNTASQVVLYDSFNAPLPNFWHVPIISNMQGKKLSKRDFGFSLSDLKNAGYLPEAICNYLGIIGGSFTQEILSLDELVNAFDFEHLHSTGRITYDLEKLRWVNQKWLARYDTHALVKLCLPFLVAAYPESATLSDDTLATLVGAAQATMVTLQDVVAQLAFYFKEPVLTTSSLHEIAPQATVQAIINLLHAHQELLSSHEAFIEHIKKDAKDKKISIKELFGTVRMLLTGAKDGMGIGDLLRLLPLETIRARITKVLP